MVRMDRATRTPSRYGRRPRQQRTGLSKDFQSLIDSIATLNLKVVPPSEVWTL
jgi:hypothetical protein